MRSQDRVQVDCESICCDSSFPRVKQNINSSIALIRIRSAYWLNWGKTQKQFQIYTL
jgi:hypothetical protein